MSTLKKYSPEWIAEAKKAPIILQAALDHPDDLAIRNAVIETMEKLGFIVPIAPDSQNQS
jgi:hypothetical protein